MMPCRSIAIDSARRTVTSPSGPSRLDTMNADEANDGPWVTVSAGFDSS